MGIQPFKEFRSGFIWARLLVVLTFVEYILELFHSDGTFGGALWSEGGSRLNVFQITLGSLLAP